MSAHLCTEITPGCFRCELNLDEFARTEPTTPACEHLDHLDVPVYQEPPRLYDNDRQVACPCCGATAWVSPGEKIGPCPYCDVEAIPRSAAGRAASPRSRDGHGSATGGQT